MERNWMTYTLLVGMYNGTASLESWQFLIKFNMKLPHDIVIVLLDIKAREMKIYFHTITCIHMFLVDLYVLLKNGNPPTYPSMGEWLSKLL